jgi:DnaJ family protein A protein 2
MEAGDVIFVLSQKPHENFQRKGNDLFTEISIPLIEALCGFQIAITHLDNKQILVKKKKKKFFFYHI